MIEDNFNNLELLRSKHTFVTYVNASRCQSEYELRNLDIGRTLMTTASNAYYRQDLRFAMPSFFFDIQDGHLITDNVGSEFPDVHAARDAAISVLPDIARDHMRARDAREVSVLMRDEAGRNLFTASLTLNTKWLVETA